MLYGLTGKIGVCGGHGDGANKIPSPFNNTAELKAYREGTSMRVLATAIEKANPDKIVNLRTESSNITWKERALRAANAKVNVCIECHTNWSTNSAGQPNSNIFLVIVPLYNPIHGIDEQKKLATDMFGPLAESMKMKFSIRTKKGGGEWDWYSFLNECNQKSIPHPFIVEHGYHIDYAQQEEAFRNLIVNRYTEIVGTPTVVVPDDPASVEQIVHTVVRGDTLSKIGKAYGVSWPEIALLNNITSPYTIYPGQALVIKEGVKAILHTVVSGDSLYRIGKAYDVTWRQIALDNGISGPLYIIHPGQVLTIYK